MPSPTTWSRSIPTGPIPPSTRPIASPALRPPVSPPYVDRAAIEAGHLRGRGLELAYLADPVDAFFIHIQGAARIELADGGTMRVTYAAKTGHPYTAIGGVLVKQGALTLPKRRWRGSGPGSPSTRPGAPR